MKRILLSGLFLAVSATVLLAQERFTDRLSPGQRQAAGLDQLSPQQLAALDALVQQDRQQGVAQVKEKVRAELRDEVRAQVKAEVKAEVKEQVKADVRTEMQKAREAETRILSRIAGKYSGWEGNTQFKLENGQVWRQNEPGVYYISPVDSPAVLIEKVYGSWRLYDQAGGWIKVVRIK
jgi:hypothetical protein